MSLLQVQNLVVEFPTRRGTLRALDDISFDIAPGEILGVVGESGAGKSLTGASIIGLLEPPGRVASGQIVLQGQRIDQLSAGAMRYVLERRLGVAVVPIRTQRLARADLADYDVLLVPEGEPSAILGEGGQRTIRDFVRRGGVLVAVGDSLETFSGGETPMLKVKREAALGCDGARTLGGERLLDGRLHLGVVEDVLLDIEVVRIGTFLFAAGLALGGLLLALVSWPTCLPSRCSGCQLRATRLLVCGQCRAVPSTMCRRLRGSW
mgnify:CR=1 FL=1